MFLVAVLSACSVSEAASPVTARDSAGIQIVENHSPEHPALAWRVAEHPMTRIGNAGADPSRQLNRPTSALRLPGGHIVIADQGDASLRFFDTNGTPIRTVGRAGAGPGEFRFLWWVRPMAGDSLLAYDATLFRISVFDSAGGFHRSTELPGRAGYYWRQAVDVFPNGDAVLYAVPNGASAREEGRHVRTHPLFRWRRGRMDLDSLGVADIRVAYAARMGRTFLEIPEPFGRAVDFAPWRDRLVGGWTDAWELKVVGDGGSVEAIYRIPHDPIPVTGPDREAALEFLGTRSLRDQVRQTVARVAADLPMASTMPAFGRWAWERVPSQDPVRPSLVVDALDHLWVLQYRPPGTPRGWEVLRPDGRWLGAVRLPDGLEPFEIGRDYVLGWRQDDLGLISVELYALERGRST
jgi:hypothetical protein